MLIGVLNAPRLPLKTVDTTLPTGWDGTPDATPANSAALVTALSNVVQNSGIYIIELTAGTTYTGTFVIDNNAGTDWLIIRSSGWTGSPPVAEGTRALPSDASSMATIEQTGSTACLRMDFGTHNIRLIGVEFTTAAIVTVYNLVGFGSGNTVPAVQADVANDVIYDRCYITSTSTVNRCRTGIQVNCNNFACIDSYIDNIKDTADAQTILIRIGTGMEIRNCFLESTGENIMSGGNDNAIEGGIAEDITISKCHLFKRDLWNKHSPSYGGIDWGVKNMFEIKMGLRIHLHSNVLEHNWQDNQVGYAILLAVGNQGGGNRWARVEDVIIENNLIKRTGRFLNIVSEDLSKVSGQFKRLRVRNNLVHTHGGSTGGGTEDFGITGRTIFFVVKADGRPALDVRIEHNTFVFQEAHLGNDHIFVNIGNLAVKGLTVINNIWDDARFTAWLDRVGTEILDVTISGNGIFFNPAANSYAARLASFATDYPNDVKADTIALALFTDNADQDYTLQGSSPFKNAADDGTDCGVNFKELNAAIAGVE